VLRSSAPTGCFVTNLVLVHLLVSDADEELIAKLQAV
jgi:hypothetical protein